MDKIIVYVDDAEYALRQIAPMENHGPAGPHPAGGQPTHWVLVACPPRMTRHINKWVNHTARENWRNKWAEKLFAQITPSLLARGDRVTTLLAHGSLTEMTEELQKQHGTVRVLDARRPKFGQELPPVTADQPAGQDTRWSVPGAIFGMGAVLILAGE